MFLGLETHLAQGEPRLLLKCHLNINIELSKDWILSPVYLCNHWTSRGTRKQNFKQLLKESETKISLSKNNTKIQYKKNKQPVTDPLLTPMEKASLKAMSLEEAKIRRAELQRTRALQSYYEARARREKRIKSKKYHRVLKKGKAKKALKSLSSCGRTAQVLHCKN